MFSHYQWEQTRRHPEEDHTVDRGPFEKGPVGVKMEEDVFELKIRDETVKQVTDDQDIPANNSVIPRSCNRFLIFSLKCVPPSIGPSGMDSNVVGSTISASTRA